MFSPESQPGSFADRMQARTPLASMSSPAGFPRFLRRLPAGTAFDFSQKESGGLPGQRAKVPEALVRC
jgi:hypothetical protein